MLKYLKILGLVICVMTIAFAGFVVNVIGNSGVSEALNPTAISKKVIDVVFEEGALLREKDFAVFRAYSNELKFDEVINKNLIKDNDGILEIKNDFKLANLRKNDCKSIRCLQYKVPFSKIPNVLSRGLIGIEDYRFLDHFGIDIISILRAIVQDIKAGALVQGGSTLTQQLVKNLFFTNERKFTRKVKEAILAIYIEYKFDKTTILENYFNEVFWGSINGIYIKGIQSAALAYFGKDIELLSQYEAAIMVSMLKGPSYYNPIRQTKRLRDRADFIYSKLKDLNLYNRGTSMKWTSVDWAEWIEKLNLLQSNSYIESIYLASEDYSSELQYLKFKAIVESKELLESKKDVSTDLSVKFLITDKNNELTHYTRFERNKERAINEERHQIGSTIKPLLYSLLIDFGVSLDDLVSMAPVKMSLKSGTWEPRESHKIEEEEITARRALQESFNNPLIRLVERVGFDKFQIAMSEIFPDMMKPLAEYPAQLLGTTEISIRDLNQKYQQMFTSECVREEHSVISALADVSKTTIRRVVKDKLTHFRIFGKTGTTNNGFDNWFVGYDGHITYVIWTGVEEGRDKLKSLPLYGSNTSFKIFQESLLFSGRRLGASLCRL